ncbi:hypothetical protein PR202_ga18702 [Eleusine coracana subsp. coracana]|uniref:Uncharacterized protein n=1 Tax=Eleusine coracana subsp. coracana TaxID=191504 RepID=A0AAV5CUJ5_ELECO|nr:hypothetical protein PR202_ga18702 [Eleusine coracana subsp. coracana]
MSRLELLRYASRQPLTSSSAAADSDDDDAVSSKPQGTLAADPTTGFSLRVLGGQKPSPRPPAPAKTTWGSKKVDDFTVAGFVRPIVVPTPSTEIEEATLALMRSRLQQQLQLERGECSYKKKQGELRRTEEAPVGGAADMTNHIAALDSLMLTTKMLHKSLADLEGKMALKNGLMGRKCDRCRKLLIPRAKGITSSVGTASPIIWVWVVFYVTAAPMAFNPDWLVVAGEESEEAALQNERIFGALEAIYPRPSNIPPNPFVSPDVIDSNYDDSQTQLVPLIPIEEDDSFDQLEEPPVDLPNNYHQSDKYESAVISVPRVSDSSITATMKHQANGLMGASNAGMPTEPDVLAAASAAYTAIMQSNQMGSMIDQDLLIIKILSDPAQLERLMKEHGTVKHEQTTSAAVPPMLPGPQPQMAASALPSYPDPMLGDIRSPLVASSLEICRSRLCPQALTGRLCPLEICRSSLCPRAPPQPPLLSLPPVAADSAFPAAGRCDTAVAGGTRHRQNGVWNG